jgi:hypothetical protein
VEPTPLDLVSLRGVQFASQMLLHNFLQHLLQRDAMTGAFTERALDNMPNDVKSRILLDRLAIHHAWLEVADGLESIGISA